MSSSRGNPGAPAVSFFPIPGPDTTPVATDTTSPVSVANRLKGAVFIAEKAVQKDNAGVEAEAISFYQQVRRRRRRRRRRRSTRREAIVVAVVAVVVVVVVVVVMVEEREHGEETQEQYLWSQ